MGLLFLSLGVGGRGKGRGLEQMTAFYIMEGTRPSHHYELNNRENMLRIIKGERICLLMLNGEGKGGS